jgi:lysophospholipase L1-like esterase
MRYPLPNLMCQLTLSLMLAFISLPHPLPAAPPAAPTAVPDWVPAMQKVHAGFAGQAGYIVQFGDSITESLAFWSPLGWDEPQQYLGEVPADGFPHKPENKRWRDVILGTRDKGREHGNQGGWRIANLLDVADRALAEKKPEVALIMVGTNDIAGNMVPKGYRAGVEQLVDKCLSTHCVPILSTIPPRKDHDKAVDEVNTIVREIAAAKQIPLVDYYAEIIRRRPEQTWLGTLISTDGVHPSGDKTNVYSEENLQNDGYALRNWLTFLKYREVYFQVLEGSGK